MFIGITTSPREERTLDKTITSLRKCGFDKLHIFAEPGSLIDDDNTVVSRRKEKYGAWANWFWGLKELYDRNQDQNYYMMCQDDIVATIDMNIKEYVDTLPMTHDIGLYSLYTPDEYLVAGEWNDIQKGSGLQMAQCLIFPKAVMYQLLHSEELWRFPGTYGIDNRLGTFAKYQKKKVLYRTPSLFKHIGHTSTIWH